MAWDPRIIICSGPLEGQTPQGTLSECPVYLDNNLLVAPTALSGTAQYTDEGGVPLETWAGAFGSDGQRLVEYAKSAGDFYDGILAEIEVNPPRNAAPNYKHTICFRGSVYHETYLPDPDHGLINWYIRLESISRRVYPDGVTPAFEYPIYSRTSGALNFDAPWIGDPAYFTSAWFVKRLYCAFSFLHYDNDDYFGAFFYETAHQSDDDQKTIGTLLAVKVSVLETAFEVDDFEPEQQEDPNEEEPPEDGPGRGGSSGGEGDHILPDEPVDFPPLPEIGAASVSWLKLFKMTVNQLNDFGEAMIPKTAWQLLQVYFTNPLDAIIGILLIPVDAPTSGARTPALGDFTWPSAYPIINNEFCILDCGAIRIPPYWDSAFDFSPFTKFQVFLPFIGYRDIDADEIMGAGIHIKYYIDLCTGDCTAMIGRSASPEDAYGPRAIQIIAQYNGNCATRVPTGRISHDSAVTASMSLLGSAINVGGAIMGAALGNPGNISASQVANQVSGGTMTAVNGFKKEVQRSGNIAAAAGYMGITRPYIIRQIPRQDLPKEYKRLEGYPANKGGTLAQFAGTGLNTVEAMELTGFDGFESEREELLSILRGGVIV